MKTAPVIAHLTSYSLPLKVVVVAALSFCCSFDPAQAALFNLVTKADSTVSEAIFTGPSTTNANYSTFGGAVPSGSILADNLAPDASGTFSITHSVANGGGTIASGTTGESWLLRINPGTTGASARSVMTWLQFDLSQFTPADVVNSASLNLASVRLASGNPATGSSGSSNKLLSVFGLRQSQMLIGGSPWTEANLNYNSAPSMFQDTETPGAEKTQFVYDMFDFVPNGDTDATNLVATEIVGDAANGVLIPGLLPVQIMTQSTDQLVSFVQTAINNGDDYVTFVFARRESSASDQFYISREGAAAAGNPSFAPQLSLDVVTPVVLHPGDFDSDGDVDGADFVAWQTNFPKANSAILAEGDADADGDVDGADFVVWQTNFPFTPSPAVGAVPEPAAGMLIFAGLGTLGIGWLRGRRAG